MNDLNDRESTPERQEPDLKTTCPFCLRVIEVHLDIKGRPYWRCWRCEVRSFGTKTAFRELQASGWIWSEPRPADAVKAWLEQMMQRAGLREERDG